MSIAALGQFVPLILIFVIFYFLLIRPQQKRVAEHKSMISKLITQITKKWIISNEISDSGVIIKLLFKINIFHT